MDMLALGGLGNKIEHYGVEVRAGRLAGNSGPFGQVIGHQGSGTSME